MFLTDIQPHTFLCPLPKGYWWEVNLHQRLDSVHMHLRKKRYIGDLGDTVVVSNFSSQTTEDVATELIDRSYGVWQKWVRTSHEKSGEWQARADELYDRLNDPRIQVKVKVDKVK